MSTAGKSKPNSTEQAACLHGLEASQKVVLGVTALLIRAPCATAVAPGILVAALLP